MKIIHTADLHLGSSLCTHFDLKKAKERRAEILGTFVRLCEYAKENGVKAVLLCGDIFDEKNPQIKEKKIFFSSIENAKDVNFYYIKGNHDSEKIDLSDAPDNFFTFGEEWKKYECGDVSIYGIDIKDKISESLYSNLILKKEEKNIVMLHAQVSKTQAPNTVNLSKLKDKNIDYLALGHVHSYSSEKLDGRGDFVYCGCLEGRGFDELGEKGFVLIDTDTKEHAFVAFAKRNAKLITLDASEYSDVYSLANAVTKILKEEGRENPIRVELVGDVDFDTEGVDDMIKSTLFGYYLVSVKDKTRRKIDAKKYENDRSLRGEFVRSVLESDETEEDKIKIINLGLMALEGRKE